MKENDGRGARRKLVKKFALILCGCLLVVLAVVVFHRAAGGGGHGPRSGSGNHRPRSLLHHLDGRDGGGGGGGRNRPRHLSSAGGDTATNNKWDADEDLLEAIVKARVHLVDIVVDRDEQAMQGGNGGDEDSYSGVYGKFCRLDWDVHKADPSSTPMFRDLVQKSPDCSPQNQGTMELRKAAKAVRAFDKAHAYAPASPNVPKLLNVTAFVFHESRCGSTLVANLCVAANPQGHRVYSESAPPIAALRYVCGEAYTGCSVGTSASVLRDVIYLMSRTDDPREERVFFKIQSIGSRNLATFQNAFPDTPWLFVYRDPVQVMMSHLANGPRNANCVRGRRQAGTLVQEIVRRHHKPDVDALGAEEYCAAHLATITESAAEALEGAEKLAVPVNYEKLPEILFEEIFPKHLGVPVGDAELHRLERTALQYSKGRGGQAGEFKGDSDKKERMASSAVRTAAEEFLQESFEALERASSEVFAAMADKDVPAAAAVA